MKHQLWLLIKSLVLPFYKENTGVFFFVFVIMFGVVNMVDGAGIFEYHYSLARGMVGYSHFMLQVLAIWGLYLRKGVSFVTGLLQRPAYGFLHILRTISPVKQWLLWLGVSAVLFLPVLLYLVWVVYVGIGQGLIVNTVIALAVAVAMCLAAAGRLVYYLNHLCGGSVVVRRMGWWQCIRLSYPAILLLQVVQAQKVLWAGIKLYSCGVLYLVARNNNTEVYDLSFPFLFFNFGVLVNGMVVYRIRELEETALQFYRSLPVSLLLRWLGYAGLYAILMLPELVTVAALTPQHLHVADAFRMAGVAYGTVLLMHSISFLRAFAAVEYLKVLAALFGVQILFVIYSQWMGMCVLFMIAALIIYCYGYYRYQPATNVRAAIV